MNLRPLATALAWMTLIPWGALDSASHAQDAVLQGNDARTGEVPKLDLPTAPVVLWKFTSRDPDDRELSLGGVVAAGARVFSSNSYGELLAVRADNGAQIWKQLDGEASSEAPLVMGDVAYYCAVSGIWALSADQGDILWHFEIPGGANETSPLMIGDQIVAAGYDGYVYAFDAQSGAEQWNRSIVDDAPRDPPGVDGKRARLGEKPARPRVAASDGQTLFQPVFDQCRLVALDAKSGALRWSFQAQHWIHANPVVAGNRVYIGSQDRKFYALDKATGKPVWTFQAGSRIEAGAAVAGDSVYVGSCDGNLHSLHAQTGALQWKFRLDPDATGRACPIYAAPLLAGDTLYQAGMEGQIYALNAATGELRWKMRPSADSELDSDLATDGQRLFVVSRTNDGKGENALIAIGRKP